MPPRHGMTTRMLLSSTYSLFFVTSSALGINNDEWVSFVGFFKIKLESLLVWRRSLIGKYLTETERVQILIRKFVCSEMLWSLKVGKILNKTNSD